MLHNLSGWDYCLGVKNKGALKRVGAGCVYKSNDGRSVVVQRVRYDDWNTPFFKWFATLDGHPVGSGSLSSCRKLLATSRQTNPVE